MLSSSIPLRQRLVAAACALALAAPLLPSPAWAQHNLPALGDSATEDFGVGAERKLGDQIMREIRRDPEYLDDPVLLEYLQALWTPLVAQARANGNIAADFDTRFAWEAFLVRDRSVNAFALPGGFIGVHLGLIALTATPDELASVLAHELTHVTQRHISRSFANSKRQSMLSIAGLILGVLAASRANSGDGINAAIVGSQAVAVQGQLNFSRDMEREADRIGFAVLTGAGYSPGGMAAMFEKLDQASRLNDSGGFPYLRTHPLTSERIGEARAKVNAFTSASRPLVVAGPAPVTALEHTLAQARSRVLMDTRVDALRRWQALDAERAVGTPTEQLAAAASSALASTLLRDMGRADASLARAGELLRANGRNDLRAQRALSLLTAESMLARGDAAKATAVLQPFVGENSRPVMLLLAQAALAAAPAGVALAAPGPVDSALRRSAEELQTRVATQPGDAASWAMLGQVWTRLGQPLRALRADAEAQLALGDMTGAMERLRAAQRRVRSGDAADFIEASVIDSRLRDVESQFRQLSAEERRQ